MNFYSEAGYQGVAELEFTLSLYEAGSAQTTGHLTNTWQNITRYKDAPGKHNNICHIFGKLKTIF